jgi:hypothetical protein
VSSAREAATRPAGVSALLLDMVVFGAVGAASAVVAYLSLFTVFAPHDDEGYFLVALKGFLEGEAMYDDVYSVHGPLYWEVVGAIFAGLGLEVTHEAARLVTLVFWIGAALLSGLAVRSLTGSLLLGLGTSALVAKVLLVFPGEPLHPSHFVVLVLAGVAAIGVVLVPRRAPVGMAALGAGVTGVALIKPNLGALAFLAVAFALVTAVPRLHALAWLRWFVSAAMVAAPFLLMAVDIDEDGYTEYAFHVGFGALALVLVAGAGWPPAAAAPRLLAWIGPFLAAAVAAALVLVGVILTLGTSLGGLVDGIILEALRVPGALAGPPGIPSSALNLGFVTVLAAAVYAHGAETLGRRRVPLLAVALARLLAGVGIWLTVMGEAPLSWSVPLVWVAAVPTRGEGAQSERRFARVFLPALALLQTLHAYPVAGSQIAWASFLLVPVGAVCIADGLRELRDLSERAPGGRSLAGFALDAIAVVLLAKVLIAGIAFPAQHYSSLYRFRVPLGLPGAESIRVTPDERAGYRGLVGSLRAHCDTFSSIPGVNGLYLLAQQEPPTYVTTSGWMFLFDRETQARIVRELEQEDRLCVVRHEFLLNFWSQGRPVPNLPLVAYLENDERFRAVAQWGGFELLAEAR